MSQIRILKSMPVKFKALGNVDWWLVDTRATPLVCFLLTSEQFSVVAEVEL